MPARALTLTLLVILALPILGFGGVFALSELRLRDLQRGPAFDHPINTNAETLEHGRHIARTRGCFGCHGQQLEGRDFDEQWDWPERAVAPNLTAYAREHDAAVIEAAVRQGIGQDGRALVSMPSFNFTRLSDEDMAALIAYLRSAAVIENALPSPRLGWLVRWDFARGNETHMAAWVRQVPPLRVSQTAEPQRALGEYLAMTMCNECHGLDVRGQTFYPPATPDLAIVAAYSRADFEALIETGIGAGGRELGLMTLVAPDRFRDLSSEEVDALYAYLTSLQDEPVQDAIWRPH